jgi:hypothetical protein
LAHALDHDPSAIIVTEQRCFSGGTKKKLKLDLAEPKNASDLGEDDSIAYSLGCPPRLVLLGFDDIIVDKSIIQHPIIA